MAGNSWQQPVAGEPALGTPHLHACQFLDNASQVIGTTDYDLSAYFPVGTKMIWVVGTFTSVTAGADVVLESCVGNLFDVGHVQVANGRGDVRAPIPVAADRKVRLIVENGNMTGMYFWASLYWL